MKAEAWLVIEFPKPRHNWQKREPKITKVMQRRPAEGLAVKVVLEMPDEEWAPTIMLQIDPLMVKGSVSADEMRDRAKETARQFLQENM